MNIQKLYQTLIYLVSSLLLGLLMAYPLASQGAVAPPGTVTNDSTQGFRPNIQSADIQCKRVVINPSSNVILQASTPNTAINACPTGYVPVGINLGYITENNAQTSHDWIITAEISKGLFVSYYAFQPLYYNQGNASINKVQMACVPRQIIFQPNPCP